MTESKLKVVFIAGCGRSGTTILGQLLGEFDNFVNIGEGVRYLFDRTKELPCGCGSSAFDCLFWKDIIRAIPEDLAARGAKLFRMRNFPSLFLHTKNGEVPQEYRAILATMGEAYRKVAKQSGRTVIIDSSKGPTTALLARMIPEIELHVIHVVRSPHSVVASWTKKNGYLAVHPPQKVVAWWWAYNLLSEALKWRADTYRLVRYEDFARNPSEVLQQITTDVTGSPLSMPFLSGNRATVHVQHSLAGNPSKFNTGEIKITDGNRSADSGGKLLMNLVTFPLQRRYQYLPTAQKP